MKRLPEPMASGWVPAQAIADQIDTWAKEFLALYAQSQEPPLEERDYLPMFRTIDVRHAGRVFAADRMPAVIISPTTEGPHRVDPQSGAVYADFGLTVHAVHETRSEKDTGDTLHAYISILRQMLMWLPPAGGLSTALEFEGGDFRGVQRPKGRDIWLAGQLRYSVKNVRVGTRQGFDPTLEPREDPYEGPLDDIPTVADDGAHLILGPLED